MIPIQELRIGNWIHTQLNESGFVKIDINHLKHIAQGNEYGYKPIPLTPEILEACGFKMVGERPFYSMRLYLNSTDELCWYSQDKELRYQTRGAGFTRYFNTKYLHQLQNLFYDFRGTELPVNLKEKV